MRETERARAARPEPEDRALQVESVGHPRAGHLQPEEARTREEAPAAVEVQGPGVKAAPAREPAEHQEAVEARGKAAVRAKAAARGKAAARELR